MVKWQRYCSGSGIVAGGVQVGRLPRPFFLQHMQMAILSPHELSLVVFVSLGGGYVKWAKLRSDSGTGRNAPRPLC